MSGDWEGTAEGHIRGGAEGGYENEGRAGGRTRDISEVRHTGLELMFRCCGRQEGWDHADCFKL